MRNKWTHTLAETKAWDVGVDHTNLMDQIITLLYYYIDMYCVVHISIYVQISTYFLFLLNILNIDQYQFPISVRNNE